MYTLDDEDLYDLYAVDSTYNPSDAAAFAQEYAGHKSSGISSGTQHPSGYCPYVYYYNNDCANFVSQCLRAGGLKSTKASGWWCDTQSTGSAQPDESYAHCTGAWVRVIELRNYLVDTLGYDETRIYGADEAKKGNTIYYSEYSGSSTLPEQHTVMIVEVKSNGDVLICGHTQDAYRFVYNTVLSTRECYTIQLT